MVSLGNTLVPVPVLDATMDEATVTTRLDEAGLVVGSRTNPFDETVPPAIQVAAEQMAMARAATSKAGDCSAAAVPS